MKTVFFTRAAAKALRRLPASVQAQVEAKLDRYAETGAGDVRALKGEDGARLRVGGYRVVFIETEVDVTVIRVGDRKDVYD